VKNDIGWAFWPYKKMGTTSAVETIPPLYAAGIRHLTSGTILLLWCLAKKVKPTASQVRTGVVIGILFFLLGHGPLHWAETRVPSGLASLLVATEPIFVFFLAAWSTKKWQFNWKLGSGIFVGLAGVGRAGGAGEIGLGRELVGQAAAASTAAGSDVSAVTTAKPCISRNFTSGRRTETSSSTSTHAPSSPAASAKPKPAAIDAGSPAVRNDAAELRYGSSASSEWRGRPARTEAPRGSSAVFQPTGATARTDRAFYPPRLRTSL